MMQTVTREQALAGTLALVNPAHPLQARPAPEALVPAMPGKRLCSVKPGMVFTSLNTMRPSGV